MWRTQASSTCGSGSQSCTAQRLPPRPSRARASAGRARGSRASRGEPSRPSERARWRRRQPGSR
eukprot:6017313-Prymnesium_polylepis.1